MSALSVSFSMSDEDVRALGWAAFLPPANEPQRAHLPRVEIACSPHDGADAASLAFWRLVGDLAADLVIDGTAGQWSTTSVGPREIIAP